MFLLLLAAEYVFQKGCIRSNGKFRDKFCIKDTIGKHYLQISQKGRKFCR